MASISLYTKTFRMILNLREEQNVSWVPIYESFCDLRESLLCAVCRNLTVMPYQRFTDECFHNVCRDCLGGRLQIPCIWCADDKVFEDNEQMKIIMQCYKNMCKYIMTCDFFRNSLLSDMSLSKLNFITMVTEGSKLTDDYNYATPQRLFGQRLNLLFNVGPGNINNVGPGSINSMDRNKNISRLNLNKDNEGAVKNSLDDNCLDSEKPSNFTSYFSKKSRMAQRPRNCHCGITTVHHRKLICRGQKCPCFVAGRACFNCRCRGCRNSQKYRAGPASFHKYRSHSKVIHSMNAIEDQAKTAEQAPVNSSDD